jgi:release factor glutamine methyltransferase
VGSSDEGVTTVRRLRAAGCVFAEDEAFVLSAAASSAEELEAMVRRRVGGEPLEVIVGWAAFRGLRIAIEPGVFVPRQRTTAFLAGVAIGLSPGLALDLCCGSGAIAAALLAEVSGVQVWATDIEAAAVRCARRNLPPDRVLLGDLFESLPIGLRFDVIVANAPYVPTAAIAGMPSEARDHEPLVTLDGGADGLDVHRRIAAAASGWLGPGGSLLVEVSALQAPEVAALFDANELVPMVLSSADGDATVVRGTSVGYTGER